MFNKPRKHLRFLIKVSFIDKEAALTKLSPILNQMSIDETSHIDDLLFSFFTHGYHPSMENKRFTASIYFTIWKNKSIYNHIKIKPFLFYEYILKMGKRAHELNCVIPRPRKKNTFVVSNFRGRRDLQPKSYSLSFVLLECSSWSITFGYQFQLSGLIPALSVYRGVARSYLHRNIMLGRKINFRRKTQKQKFEDF